MYVFNAANVGSKVSSEESRNDMNITFVDDLAMKEATLIV